MFKKWLYKLTIIIIIKWIEMIMRIATKKYLKPIKAKPKKSNELYKKTKSKRIKLIPLKSQIILKSLKIKDPTKVQPKLTWWELHNNKKWFKNLILNLKKKFNCKTNWKDKQNNLNKSMKHLLNNRLCTSKKRGSPSVMIWKKDII